MSPKPLLHSEPPKGLAVRCPRNKCGEYNMLRCAAEAGHKGDCSFVVDYENDYPHNKHHGRREGAANA